jgi:hypothetical protein
MPRDKYDPADPIRAVGICCPVPAKISGRLIFTGKDFPFFENDWL